MPQKKSLDHLKKITRMATNIKKVAHDLLPLSEAVSELSAIISELLNAIEPSTAFETNEAATYFIECVNASKKLAVSAELIRKYVQKINYEADKEGMLKDP